MGRSSFVRCCPNPFTCGVKKEDATTRTAGMTVVTCCMSTLFVVGMLILMATTVWANNFLDRNRTNHLLETCMLKQGGLYQPTPAWATESIAEQDDDNVGSAIRGYFDHSPIASFTLDDDTKPTIFNEKNGHPIMNPNGVFTQCRQATTKGATGSKLKMVESYMQYKPYCFFLMARNAANQTFATPMNPMLYRNFNGDAPMSGTAKDPLSNSETWARHCSGEGATAIGEEPRTR
jgi:hypothetical protein